ncbi:MAG: phosphodiester glycosidase family protein [Polyangiaceae bacterium]
MIDEQALLLALGRSAPVVSGMAWLACAGLLLIGALRWLKRVTGASPSEKGSWLALVATLLMCSTFAVPFASIALQRRWLFARSLSTLRWYVAGEAEMHAKLANNLWLLGAWALGMACLRTAQLVPVEQARSRKLGYLLLGSVPGVAVAAAALHLRTVWLGALAPHFSDDGGVRLDWRAHFAATHAPLLRAWLMLAAALALLVVLSLFKNREASSAIDTPKQMHDRRRLALLVTLCGGCFAVFRATRPYAAEAAQELPRGYYLTQRDARSSVAPTLEGVGPDTYGEAPQVRVARREVRIDGLVGDLRELRDVLKNKRELYEQINGKAPAGGFSVTLDVAEDVSIAQVEGVLAAVSAAGMPRVQLLLAQHIELERPVFGKLVGGRLSALALELQSQRAECKAPQFVPRIRDIDAPFAHFVADWLARRRQGALCKEVGPLGVFAGEPNIVARRVHVAGVDFDVIQTRSGIPRISTVYQSEGKRFATLGAVRDHYGQQREKVIMVMNAGMFTPEHRPVGLLVSDGRELSPLNLSDARGNFFMKPNGVFALLRSGQARIVPSERYHELEAAQVLHATQSGPLVLAEGKEHPKLRPDSENRQLRNAVGVSPEWVSFVISRQKVTFHELVLALRELGCSDGLYLDGSISRMYAPLLERYDSEGDFGPMLVVVQAP